MRRSQRCLGNQVEARASSSCDQPPILFRVVAIGFHASTNLPCVPASHMRGRCAIALDCSIVTHEKGPPPGSELTPLKHVPRPCRDTM